MTSERAPTIAESLSVYVTRAVTQHARAADFLAIGIILAVGLATHAPGLSHAGIAGWDESLHQAAVRGTYETPLRPHIYEAHLFPFDRYLVSGQVSCVWHHVRQEPGNMGQRKRGASVKGPVFLSEATHM